MATIFETSQKFSLINGYRKYPSDEWGKKERHRWTTDKHTTGHRNWGLPTGKVNGVTCVDIDLYAWDDAHPFLDFIGGTGEPLARVVAWAAANNTPAVITGHDGAHLFFSHVPELKSNPNTTLHIDIRNDGYYVVGVGSKIKRNEGKCAPADVGTLGFYRWATHEGRTLDGRTLAAASAPPMPAGLLDWLNTHQQPKTKTKSTSSKTKDGKPDTFNVDDVPYAYELTDAQALAVGQSLPAEAWTDGREWLKVTTAYKILDKRNVWDKLSHDRGGDKYDEANNAKQWDGIASGASLPMVDWLYKQAEAGKKAKDPTKGMCHFTKYKRADNRPLTGEGLPHTFIHRRKLGNLATDPDDTAGVDLSAVPDVFLKSDTGTGKTTLLKKYVSKAKRPVISIVSRVSLADAQYLEFQKEGIDVYNYKNTNPDHWYFNTGESVIITLESLQRLREVDFSDYIVFLDEFDSMARHLLSSPTLRERTLSWCLLRRIVRECRQVIAVDADINANRLKLVNDLGRQFQVIENTHQHNKGRVMEEATSYTAFVDKLEASGDALVCCDSKTCAETIFTDLCKVRGATCTGHDDRVLTLGDSETGDAAINAISTKVFTDKTGRTYALITSDTSEHVELDAHDVVVFSPRILYGLDSVRARPVFALYKEQTIGPRAMLQQVARCRDITRLVYFFGRKKFKPARYSTREDVTADVQAYKRSVGPFREMLSESEAGRFEEMLGDLLYEEDAYSTNKYAHFKAEARRRGFVDDGPPVELRKADVAALKSAVQVVNATKTEAFDPTDDIHADLNKKYFDFPEDVMETKSNLFLKPTERKYYFNARMFFLESSKDWNKKLGNKKDFIIKKMMGDVNKFRFITKFQGATGMKDKTQFTFNDRKIPKDKADGLFKEFVQLFRYRGKPFNLQTLEGMNKMAASMYKKLFGAEFILPARVTVGDKRVMMYEMNPHPVRGVMALAKYRTDTLRDPEDAAVSWLFGDEATLHEAKNTLPEFAFKQ